MIPKEAMKKSYYLSYFKPFSPSWLCLAVLIVSCCVLITQFVSDEMNIPVIVLSGILVTLSVVSFIGFAVNPESIRAHQTADMLKLSRQTLACLNNGFDEKAAQRICELLYPHVVASSIVICSKEQNCVWGYCGEDFPDYEGRAPIVVQATKDTLNDGKERILMSKEELGVTSGINTINAAIIAPLMAGRRIVGTLAFYFRYPRDITATQQSIAQGFAQLVSTQIAAGVMEDQQKLATAMELKALQAQINPHFLFNTINTIASLVRTDPMKARTLLRDFAVFYRRTLDDSSMLIPLSREVEQTLRYFSFEEARFGEERVAIETSIEPATEQLLVPPFLIQPLVENSVGHAMPSEGKLTVQIGSRLEGDDMVVWVKDDGVGMSQEACENILHPESSTGIGIAVKNVHDRMCGYFGPGTHMDVKSELGEGTTVTLHLSQAAIKQIDDAEPIQGRFLK